MKIQSELSAQRYLFAMKDRMAGHLEFGNERFTGFFFGSFFSVTYHSGYEWNRRISNQKNTAIGFVRKDANGCSVSFICLKGLLAPAQFLRAFLLSPEDPFSYINNKNRV